MNLQRTARMLGVNPRTLRRWMRANAAPAHLTIGKRRYFTEEMVEQWIRARAAI